MKPLLQLLVSAACLTGCAHRVSKFYPDIIPKNFETTLTLNPRPKDSLNLLYLGCGSLVLERDGHGIITDPFFSNQRILKLAGRIKTNPDRYEWWKETISSHVSPSSIRASLVAHMHYDHVMDLPMALHDHFFPNMTGVYGNPYLPKMFGNFKNSGAKLIGLQHQQLYDPRELTDKAYQWLPLSPRIRALAIESNHAPHLGPKIFMTKPLNETYFKNHLVWPEDKVGAFKWSGGATYSYLVDFIDGDTLRVFIQTSASDTPYGLPPRKELDQKKVDLAVLCYASSDHVKNYPAFLLDSLKPKKTILVHWEDFFRMPRDPDDVKLVRGTNPKKAKKIFESLASRKIKEHFIMPKPGTFIRVKF
jgi:hypothetical protein